MWIITRTGFVSLVEHNDQPDYLRARARRREHLADSFDLMDADIIDLGDDAPDYRWHADLPKAKVAEAMYEAILELDYASHVKEEVSGPDNVMYRSMLDCWIALRRLQDPPQIADRDWWNREPDDDWRPTTDAGGLFEDADREPTLTDLNETVASITDLAGDLAGRMRLPDDDDSTDDVLWHLGQALELTEDDDTRWRIENLISDLETR